MILESQQHADNTASKLKLLEDQIVRAKARPDTPANRQSTRSLVPNDESASRRVGPFPRAAKAHRLLTGDGQDFHHPGRP